MTLHLDDLSFAAASDAARFAKYVMEMMSQLTLLMLTAAKHEPSIQLATILHMPLRKMQPGS